MLNFVQIKDRSTITKCLGSGTFGTVEAHGNVAKKYYTPEHGTGMGTFALNEIVTYRRLGDINVQMQHLLSEDKNGFTVHNALSMPLYKISLHEWAVLQPYSIRLKWVERHAKRLYEAIQHNHSLDIVHCDLKPDNILLDNDNFPHIIDYGSARINLRAGMSFINASPHYCGPEYNDNMITSHVDYWSLGAILYFVLTKRLVNECKDISMIQSSDVYHSIEDMFDLTPETNRVIRSCLTYNPILRSPKIRAVEEEEKYFVRLTPSDEAYKSKFLSDDEYYDITDPHKKTQVIRLAIDIWDRYLSNCEVENYETSFKACICIARKFLRFETVNMSSGEIMEEQLILNNCDYIFFYGSNSPQHRRLTCRVYPPDHRNVPYH